jgi:hypothetical protein
MASLQRRTAFATAAVVCAIIAFFLSPLAGFGLALLAVVLGVLAVLRAAASRRTGVLLGFLGIVLGAVAAVVKILHGALAAIF